MPRGFSQTFPAMLMFRRVASSSPFTQTLAFAAERKIRVVVKCSGECAVAHLTPQVLSALVLSQGDTVGPCMPQPINHAQHAPWRASPPLLNHPCCFSSNQHRF